MERLVISPETQAAIDAFVSTYPQFDPDGLIYEGSNLVVDDHLQVDNSWKGVVMGGEGGLVWLCVPEWGDVMLPIDLVPYVTDRAGPDGQEMPIFDPPPEVNPQCGPSVAAAMAQMKPRRPLAAVLRDAVRRLSPLREFRALVTLERHGVLDCNPRKGGGHK